MVPCGAEHLPQHGPGVHGRRSVVVHVGTSDPCSRPGPLAARNRLPKRVSDRMERGTFRPGSPTARREGPDGTGHLRSGSRYHIDAGKGGPDHGAWKEMALQQEIGSRQTITWDAG